MVQLPLQPSVALKGRICFGGEWEPRWEQDGNQSEHLLYERRRKQKGPTNDTLKSQFSLIVLNLLLRVKYLENWHFIPPSPFSPCHPYIPPGEEESICYSSLVCTSGWVSCLMQHQLWASSGLCLNSYTLFSWPSVMILHSGRACGKGGEEGRTIRFRAITIMIRRRTDAECNSHFSLLCYCSYGLALLLALANTIHFISCFSCWPGSHPPLGSCHRTPGWLQ